VNSNQSRRTFLGTIAAASLTAAVDGWVELFDGRTMTGWRPSENKSSWSVVDGQLAAQGPRSHLFYDGPVSAANFKNFDLEVEVLARPLCNSGVYFHTAYQEKGFPEKGFEVQINNTATGEGTYRERKKTGSLYGVRNVYKQFIPDDRWFQIAVAVRGKTVQIRLDGMLVVDYTEPTPAVIPEGGEKQRFIDRGTFALQCHNDGSHARFRRVRVRPLADDLPTPGTAPVVDDLFRKVINLGRHNYPMVDYHVHLKPDLTLDAAIAKSMRDGVAYGIAANCGRDNAVDSDAALRAYVQSLQGKPVFAAMQAEGREWLQMFSRAAAAEFDYIFTDAETWTDNHGKRMRLWHPEEVGAIANAEEFMETLVDRTVGILNNEPVDIFANPTFLPALLAKDYETLWTDARRHRVIDAAVRNGVAIELNDRYKLPSASFVKMAKSAGAKFTFGANNSGAADLRRCDHGIQMIEECGLRSLDFWVPGEQPKAILRKS
jgi:hypothetical protein